MIELHLVPGGCGVTCIACGARRHMIRLLAFRDAAAVAADTRARRALETSAGVAARAVGLRMAAEEREARRGMVEAAALLLRRHGLHLRKGRAKQRSQARNKRSQGGTGQRDFPPLSPQPTTHAAAATQRGTRQCSIVQWMPPPGGMAQ